MSWYTSYFCGIQAPDNKIYPLGPFDNKGNLKYVLEKSRSFETGINESFTKLTADMWTDELEKALLHVADPEMTNEAREFLHEYTSYCPIKDLPTGDWIKRGYYLIDQIQTYEENDGDYEVFYDSISPEVYVRRMEQELKFGPPKPRKNEFGDEYTPHSCAEYSYFCYPDYNCVERDAFELRKMGNILIEDWELKDGWQKVAVLTEG